MKRSCTPCQKLEDDCYDWYDRHREKCEIVKNNRFDIILMGDSITHFWENLYGPENWKKTFAGRNVLNLGFGWDRTPNLLWRLENGEFENQKPKLFILNIGTNNLSKTEHYVGDTPLEAVDGIEAVVNKIHEFSPETEIVVMSVFQRGTNAEPSRELIRELNVILEHRMNGKRKVRLLNISEKFMSESGEIDSSLFVGDNCHPCEKGYAIWSEALIPIFQELGL